MSRTARHQIDNGKSKCIDGTLEAAEHDSEWRCVRGSSQQTLLADDNGEKLLVDEDELCELAMVWW